MTKVALLISGAALLIVLVTGMRLTNFTSYLTDNAAACNSCHVMGTVYEGWYHGGHRTVATCNDCHTPHAFIPKYLVKARSGFNHVTAFATGHIPDAIRAKESSQAIVQENCIRCHGEMVSQVADSLPDAGRNCFDCHRTVPHGTRGQTLYEMASQP